MFKQELAYLFLAIEYYTRLSKPIFLTEGTEVIDGTNRAIRYYAIIGGLVGLLSAMFGYIIFEYLKSLPLEQVQKPLEKMLKDKKFSYRLKNKMKEILYQ